MPEVETKQPNRVTIAQFLEFSAWLTSAIIVGGYCYVQAMLIPLGLHRLPIAGIEDYIRFGSHPGTLIAVLALIVLFILPIIRHPSRPFNSAMKWTAQKQWSTFARDFAFHFARCLLFAPVIIAVTYFRAPPGSSMSDFTILIWLIPVAAFGLVALDAAANYFSVPLTARNFGILSIFLCALGGLGKAAFDFHARPAPALQVTLDLSTAPPGRLFLSTSSFHVFLADDGAVTVVPADHTQTITVAP